MSNSEFREVDECERCGCETAAELEYHKDGKKITIKCCRNCRPMKAEKTIQNKLSSFS